MQFIYFIVYFYFYYVFLCSLRGIRRIIFSGDDMIVERLMVPVFARIMDMKFFSDILPVPVIGEFE